MFLYFSLLLTLTLVGIFSKYFFHKLFIVDQSIFILLFFILFIFFSCKIDQMCKNNFLCNYVPTGTFDLFLIRIVLFFFSWKLQYKFRIFNNPTPVFLDFEWDLVTQFQFFVNQICWRTWFWKVKNDFFNIWKVSG